MSIHPLYVASDLHIGDHGPRDNFTKVELPIVNDTKKANRNKQFRLFLNHVKSDGGRLLLIGDVFELWQANIGDVLSKNIDLIDEMAEMEGLEILLGNHDIDLKGLVDEPRLKLQDAHPVFKKIVSLKEDEKQESGILKKCFRDSTSGQVRTYGFMHGNEIDAFNNSPTPGTGRAIAILAGMIEDSVGGPFLEESNVLVEKDLEEKALKLKDGIWSYIFSKIFSKQSRNIFLFSALWILSALFAIVGLISQPFNAWAIASIALVILPIVISVSVVKHLWSPVKDGIDYVTGNLREYLKIWTARLPESRSSTSNVSPEDAKKDNNKIATLMKRNDCDMIILGHTHIDDITEYGCNTGTWVNEKPSFLKIYPDGSIELYRWQALSDEAGEPVLRKRLSFCEGERKIEVIEDFSNPESREYNLGCLSSIP